LTIKKKWLRHLPKLRYNKSNKKWNVLSRMKTTSHLTKIPMELTEANQLEVVLEVELRMPTEAELTISNKMETSGVVAQTIEATEDVVATPQEGMAMMIKKKDIKSSLVVAVVEEVVIEETTTPPGVPIEAEEGGMITMIPDIMSKEKTLTNKVKETTSANLRLISWIVWLNCTSRKSNH
jgi:hypothetical protein